jgi:hypothetical protein
MKVKFQEEDIQLLSSILQEQLMLELPSVPVLQVKCAVQNDQLMVLTQHPQGVSIDTERVFAILEESLQWQSQYHDEKVQLYVRISGEKLPYAKHSIIIKAKQIPETPEILLPKVNNDLEPSVGNKQLIFPPLETSEDILTFISDNNTPNNPFNSPIDDSISDHSFHSPIDEDISDPSFSSPIDENISDYSFGSDPSFSSDIPIKSDRSFSTDKLLLDESEEESANEEHFDPFEGGQNLSKGRNFSLPPLPILLGAALGIAVIFGGGAFFLTRSCVIGECKELQTAEQLQGESQQLLSQAKSASELLPLQQKLNQAIEDLKVIAQFSPHYQKAQELSLGFSEQSTKIEIVVKALQAAAAAEQKSKDPATSLDELRNRQALWRQAITPLESIKPNSELYAIAKTNLPKYKSNLETINQQLLSEETWQKKLTTAKTVADLTMKRQATAKSPNDWQRVQFAWQEVINTLKSIPTTSAAHEEAKNLIAEYKPKFTEVSNRANKEITASQNYQQAVNLANQAKVYEQRSLWQQAVVAWKQAIQKANQVAQDSSSYSQAQSLIQPYSTALAQAEEKQQKYGNLTQTRADLNSTCVNQMRFCNFTIEERGIIVDIQNHFQTLQKALSVISVNSNLPVFLYNSQGEERYMKNPQ